MGNPNDLLKFIRPYYCSNKIRVGSTNDGGYVIPEAPIKEADLLLSFGIATNIDFEKNIGRLKKNIKIFMFDPFTGPVEDFTRLLKRPLRNAEIVERKPPPQINTKYNEQSVAMPVRILKRMKFWMMFYTLLLRPGYAFKKVGLRDYCDKMFVDFPTLFSSPGIQDKKSIIIKMDIELDEYKVWQQLLPYLQKVSVIVIEVHQVGKFYQDVIDLICAFKSRGLYIVHVHGNNVDNLVEDSLIPNCLEITFCKEKYCKPITPDHRNYPDKELDAPCNPAWLDYDMPVAIHKMDENVFGV